MAGEKSTALIWYDLRKAREQAAKLEAAARAIRNECGHLGDCRADLTHSWEGDNSARFAGKMDAVTDDLEKIARQLDRTAEIIRRNAERIYDAEMEAHRIAEERTHL